MWGRTIAKQIRGGQSVLQHPNQARPPQGLPYYKKEKEARKEAPPHNFGGTRGLILRTVSHTRGFGDTRFATERTARDYNEMYGVTDQVTGAIVKGRDSDYGITVPGRKCVDQPRQVMAQVGLTDAGFEGHRKGGGQVVYFNVDDLRLPAREPRSPIRPEARQYLLSDVMGIARSPVLSIPVHSVDALHLPLQVCETNDLPGRAELRLEQNVDLGNGKTAPEAYVLRTGPEDSFPSKEHHVGAVVHEVNRFHMCRDGNEDAIAVARAKPSERESMPEFGRSELAASAATMDRMTEVGYTWHPPQYSPENRSQIREAQAVQLEKPGGLDEVGQQVNRTYRLSSGRAATVYEQWERDKRQRALSVEGTNRYLLARQGLLMRR